MKNIILASTSTLHGGSYLKYLEKEIIQLFQNAKEIIFIPYARPGGISHEEYTQKASVFLIKLTSKLRGYTLSKTQKLPCNRP